MDPPTKSTGQTKSWTSSKPKTTSNDHTKEKAKGKDEKKDEKPQKDAKASDSKYSSEFLRQKLREQFHHTDFKSTLQKDAIKEIMRGINRMRNLSLNLCDLKFN